MATAQIELRLAMLEAEVKRLKQRLEAPTEPKQHWVDIVYGAFADDPDFLEAMRLGHEYRESVPPKPVKRSTKISAKRRKP